MLKLDSIMKMVNKGKVTKKQLSQMLNIIEKDQQLEQMRLQNQEKTPRKQKKTKKSAIPEKKMAKPKKLSKKTMKAHEKLLSKYTNQIDNFDKSNAEEHNKLNEVLPIRTYNVLYKVKVLDKQTDESNWYNVTLQVQSRSRNPTDEEMQLSNESIHRHTKFSNYEFDVLDSKVVRVDEIPPSNFKDAKMRHKSIGFKILEKVNGDETEVTHDDSLCVLHYLVESLSHITVFRRLTVLALKSQFRFLKVDYEKGVSVNEMLRWIQCFFPKQLAMYAVDPLLKVFEKYNGGPHVVATLVFIVNNGHLYPVKNPNFKKSVAHSHVIKFDEIEWNVNCANFITISRKTDYNQHLDNDLVNDNADYNKLVMGELNSKDVVLYEGSLEELVVDIMNKVGYMVSGMLIKQSEITAFQHPINNQIIEYAPEMEGRKYVCNMLKNIYEYDCFRWANQSYASLGQMFFEVKYGKIPQSDHIKEDLIIYDNYHTVPTIATYKKVEYDSTCYGFDCKKSYPNAMINMEYDYPVFSIYDHFKKYDGEEIVIGEYLINSLVIPKLGNFKIEKQVIGHNEVRYLLQNNYMTKSNILFVKTASYHISKSIFSNVINDFKTIFGECSSHYKSLSHCFIGQLGKRYLTKDQAFITDSWETACCSYYQYKDKGDWSVKTVNNIHFVKLVERTRLSNENSQIFRQILSQGRIQLMELLKEVIDPKKSILVGVNTDSCFVKNPKIISFENHPKYRNEEWKPKKMSENKEIEHKPIKVVENQEWKKVETPNESCCVIGIGGSGKSTELVKQYVHGSTLVLSPTNKACDNLRKRNVSNVFTFDSYFMNRDTIPETITKILVDEFSMISPKWIKLLYELQLKRPTLVVQMYGDNNQCPPVTIVSRYFDVMNKYVFKKICGFNLVVKEYNEGTCRYDKEMFEVLNEFLKTGKLSEKLKKKTIDNNLKSNIVMRNDIREKINNQFAVKWFPDMKIIGKENKKTNNVYNSQIFYIDSIVDDKISIKETLDSNPRVNNKNEVIFYPKSYFEPAFAVTVWRYQGDTIDEPYNIHQSNLMTKKQMYTALSRTTKFDYVNIAFTNKVFVEESEPKESTEISTTKCDIGFIYYMHNDTHKVAYVGKTTVSIENRFAEHKNTKTDSMHKYDGEWKVVEVAKVHYFSDSMLSKSEKKYIHYYYFQDYQLINEKDLPKNRAPEMSTIKVGKIDDTISENYELCKNNSLKRIERKKQPEKCKKKLVKQSEQTLVLSFA